MPDLWDDAWDQFPDPTGDGEVYWGQPLGIEMAKAPNARYQAMARNAFVMKPGFDRSTDSNATGQRMKEIGANRSEQRRRSTATTRAFPDASPTPMARSQPRAA